MQANVWMHGCAGGKIPVKPRKEEIALLELEGVSCRLMSASRAMLADLWLPLCHPIEVMRAIPLQPVMQCGEWRKSGA